MNVCWVLRSPYSFERIRLDLEESSLQGTPQNTSCFLTDYVTVRDGNVVYSHLGAFSSQREKFLASVLS